MRHCSSLSLIYCGFALAISGCKNPFRVRLPQIPIKSCEPEDIVHSWALYFTWGGGMAILCGIIWLLWLPKKEIAVRLFAMGGVFMIAGRLMDFIGDYMGWIVVVCCFFGFIFNTARAEKLLAKCGFRWDINRDGIIGTERTGKPVTDEFEPTDPMSDADTEIITLTTDDDTTPSSPAV